MSTLTATATALDQIDRSLALLVGEGQVVELRALEAITRDFSRPHTESGYYDDLGKLARDAAKLDGNAKGVYFTLNPVSPDLLPRSVNRHRTARRGETTANTDIVRIRWLPVDLDAVRPSGISSTNEGHANALEKALLIRGALRGMGWPDPIFADSGNGAHLLYRVDLEVEDAGLVVTCPHWLYHSLC
jgi:hypothetical protein